MTVAIAKSARKVASTVGTDSAGFPVVKGKGVAAKAREDAFLGIAPLAYAENVSRAACIDALRTALGKAPTGEALAMAQREYVIGRIAARLPTAEFPAACKEPAAKLAHARNIVLFYAMPIQDGKPEPRITAKHKGRRSPAQHKAVRAADQAWCQIKAELGFSDAKTQVQANAEKAAKAKRGAHPAGSTGSPAAGTTSVSTSAAPDAVPSAAMTAEIARSHVATQSSLLMAFANKHAKVLPLDVASAVRRFATDVAKAVALAKSIDA